MVVKPMIESIEAYINGVYAQPGKHSVKKGSTFSFTIDVSAYDGSYLEKTSCLVWLLDKKTNKPVWQTNPFDLYYGEIDEFTGSIKVDRSMELVFQTWYQDNGWKFADQSKVWDLQVGTVHAEPKINRQDTFFLLPPDYDKKCYPGTYTVKKGSKVLFELAVNNVSGKGTCYAWLVNKGKEVWGKEFSFSGSGEGIGLTGSFIVNEESTLKFQTWYWDNGWKFYDEYGSWTFEIGQSGPKPVIDRQQTYLLLNGKRLPDPPTEVHVSGMSKLEAVLTVVNEGGSGRCKFVAYDTLKGVKLGEYIKDVPAGSSVTVRGNMTVTRNIGFKWLVYGWNGRWELTDEMG